MKSWGRLALLVGMSVAAAGPLVVAAGCSVNATVTPGGENEAGPTDDGGLTEPGDADADPGPIVRSCDPLGPRTASTLLIGPTGLEKQIVALIEAETTSIDVLIYEIDTKSIIDALIAAKNRGVAVRLVIDRVESEAAKTTFKGAGVDYRDSPEEFAYAHAKVMLFGSQASALVMSGNLNDFTMKRERNYALLESDRQDIDDLRRIFERDWQGSGDIDVSCTKLVVSPLNANDRIISFVNGAKKTLDLSVMYVTDKDTVAAVKARAAAGVSVRVLLADPAWIDGNAKTASDLAAAKIPTKYMKSLDLHAKLVVADDAAFIGSENLSTNSYLQNREVGVISNEEPVVTGVKAQFEKDWTSGVAP